MYLSKYFDFCLKAWSVLVCSARYFGNSPNHLNKLNKKPPSDPSKNLGNFPDSREIGESPIFPGNWEIPTDSQVFGEFWHFSNCCHSHRIWWECFNQLWSHHSKSGKGFKKNLFLEYFLNWLYTVASNIYKVCMFKCPIITR